MISQKIKSLMKRQGISNFEMATHLGISPQSLSNKFTRGSYTIDDIIEMLDFLGYQLIIQVKPDEQIILTKEDIRKKKQPQ